MKRVLAISLAAMMVFSLSGCGEKTKTTNTSTTLQEEKTQESSVVEESNTPSADATKDSNQSEELIDGMHPEFKEAMDGYEAFYDEYCDFMKKYQENPEDTKLLKEYGDMIAKLADMNRKLEAWESEDLNNTELKYYLDVTNRIAQKLLDVAQ